jgi:hypothetical protein
VGQIRGASVSAQDAQRGSVREPVKHELTVRRPTDHMPVILAWKPAMRGNRRRMMCVDRRSPSRVGESDLYVVAEVGKYLWFCCDSIRDEPEASFIIRVVSPAPIASPLRGSV